jgi:KaiC/GvpD/RAD55 family RecA-like ATPase
MEIIDYSKTFTTKNHKVNHAPFFPKNIFCVIAGATGCGKTNLLLNFLLQKDVLDYSDVYIYTPTLYQPAYEHLKDYYNNLENIVKDKYKITIKIAHFFEADDEIKKTFRIESNNKSYNDI